MSLSLYTHSSRGNASRPTIRIPIHACRQGGLKNWCPKQDNVFIISPESEDCQLWGHHGRMLTVSMGEDYIIYFLADDKKNLAKLLQLEAIHLSNKLMLVDTRQTLVLGLWPLQLWCTNMPGYVPQLYLWKLTRELRTFRLKDYTILSQDRWDATSEEKNKQTAPSFGITAVPTSTLKYTCQHKYQYQPYSRRIHRASLVSYSMVSYSITFSFSVTVKV